MASSLARLTAVLGCATGVNGWLRAPVAAADDDVQGNWTPAKETVTDSLDSLGWTPKPTSAPTSYHISSSDGNENRELKPRQEDDETDDNDGDFPTICAVRYPPRGGLLDPEQDQITCGGGSFCTADIRAQKVGCCDEEDFGDCTIPTTCVNSADLPLLRRQRANSRTMLCDDRRAPFCITYSYSGNFGGVYDGYQMFTCSARSRRMPITVQQTAFFDYSASTTTGDTERTSASTSTSTSTSSRRRTTTTSLRETTDPTAAPTSVRETTTADPSPGLSSSITGGSSETPAVTADTNSPSSSAPVAPAPQDADSPSSTSETGAIVGGVVGGVGGLALIATAALFFLYRRRKQNRDGQPLDGSSGPDQDAPLGATYYPGPQDPPLHPQQYGLLSPPMGQAMPYPTSNNSRAVPATLRTSNRRAVSSRAPSSLVAAAAAASPKTANDDAVSPISSRPSSASPPGSPRLGHASLVSPGMPTPIPPVRYNRFSPPPPEQFQAYRPYPGT